MGRSVADNQQMRDQRRENILAHALRLFAAKGLAATKITDIAEQAQMSQGLLYHYFRSKEEIFTEIIRGAFAKMNAAARALEEMPLPPREKILYALTQLLRSIDESEEFARTVLFIAQAGSSDVTPAAAQAVIRQESGVPYEVVTRILRAGQQAGTIKPHDAEELSLLFWTTIKGLAMHKAVNGATCHMPDARILTSLFFIEEEHGESHVYPSTTNNPNRG